MEAYIEAILNTEDADCCGIPDQFARKTSCFKVNGSFSVTSSLANGHVYINCSPAHATSTLAAVTVYTDGANALNVTNLPASGNLTATTFAGTTITSAYSWARMVGFQLTLKYVAADLTAAGELGIAMDAGILHTTGQNAKSTIKDCSFYNHGRAENVFKVNWIPTDESFAEFNTVSNLFPPGKSTQWLNIIAVGTGFPVNTIVYDGEWTCIVEAIAGASFVPDYIPRSFGPTGDPYKAAEMLKQIIVANPKIVTRIGKQDAMYRDDEPSKLQKSEDTFERFRALIPDSIPKTAERAASTFGPTSAMENLGRLAKYWGNPQAAMQDIRRLF